MAFRNFQIFSVEYFPSVLQNPLSLSIFQSFENRPFYQSSGVPKPAFPINSPVFRNPPSPPTIFLTSAIKSTSSSLFLLFLKEKFQWHMTTHNGGTMTRLISHLLAVHAEDRTGEIHWWFCTMSLYSIRLFALHIKVDLRVWTAKKSVKTELKCEEIEKLTNL